MGEAELLIDGRVGYLGGYSGRHGVDFVQLPGASFPVRLVVTTEWVLVDSAPRSRRRAVKRVLEVPTSEVADVVVEEATPDAARRWGASSRTALLSTAALTIKLHGGDHLAFKVDWPPVRTRGWVAPVQEYVRQGRGMAPEAAATGSDRYAELRQLAQLRDDGIITSEEFTAEKARLLSQ